MQAIVFIIELSVLIFVHELGHFLTAKKAGISVEEFGFGLPPRIIGKKIGETIYSLNLLPIGGFVKLLGEDGSVNKSKDKDQNKKVAFFEKSIKVRAAVLLAGVTMNVVLGVLCFSFIYFKLGIPVKVNQVSIVGTIPGSPAEKASLNDKQKIVSLNSQTITSSEQFKKLTDENSNKQVELVVENQSGSVEKILITPRDNPPVGEGPLGVIISDTELKRYPWWQMPYYSVREGLKESLTWSVNIVSSLKLMIVSLVVHGQLPKDIAGPFGIYKITGEATKAGYLAVIQFVGILSINLAIINVLPLPALDGGRVMFLIYEAIFRKKADQKVEAWINNAGMIFLLGLMVLITINDIIREVASK